MRLHALLRSRTAIAVSGLRSVHTPAGLLTVRHSHTDSFSRTILRGIVFDLDGTLVESSLDFAAMYGRVGVPRGSDILQVIADWSPERRAKAHAVIDEVETEALERMRLTPGAAELGTWLATQKLRFGLVTRNTNATVQHFHERHWSPRPAFQPALARDAGLAHKPAPDCLLHCASTWGVEPAQCVMVGDSPRDDVVAGRRAGFTTVFVSSGRTSSGGGGGAAQQLSGEQEPHHTIESLEELPALLERLFQL